MSKIKVKQIEDLYIGPFVTREDVQGIQVVIGKKEVIVPKAIQGYQGVQGSQGYQGFQGKSGVDGVQGLQGTKGTKGVQGFQGIQGIQGYQGFQGKSGVDGVQGLQGTTGTRGVQGYRGYTGSTGPQGPQGVQGIPGLTGNDGVQGFQGFQGIKGDGSEIRAREINETINELNESYDYERKYINITNDGVQSVVSHALLGPRTPSVTKEVTLDLSSNNSLQLQEYTFDNAGHIEDISKTNVTFELGIETPEKTDWQTHPTAGLISNRVPDESEYPEDIKLDELKGWVYQGSLQTVKELENLQVGDIIFRQGMGVSNPGQVYRLKQTHSTNFYTQDNWSVGRYKGQMVGYTTNSSLTDPSGLDDIAFMHHLPDDMKLAVITKVDELEYYKTYLTQKANQYPDEYLEMWGSGNLSEYHFYTHPETGEQITSGLLYWRIMPVNSVLDFGDELASASTTANQIATSTEKIYNRLNNISNTTFTSAWIETSSYEYNETERVYIWSIHYSELIQNHIAPETASVITLRQLQEEGVWTQLIPDIIFNDNRSCLEIRFDEQPKGISKVLVTGKRI